MGGKQIAVVAALSVLFASNIAAADEQSGGEGLGPSYLVDGGAIPFIWVPLAGRMLLDRYAQPRSTPLMFDKFEGGAEKADWEMPGWAVTSLGGVSALGMIASGDDSRYYHVKGLAQSLSTGVMLTGLIKVAVGRHRPDWTEDDNSPVSRRSFPSGHSTQAFAIAAYSILYLRGHVFDKYRGNKTLPWWEAATYSGIALGAAALAGERVYHNRHHLSDVMVGGLLGTASSTLFYLYQERRYDNREVGESRKQLTITPTEKGQGAVVGFSFGW
jgi:membrane-associated phospholipid phosphatase